MTEPRTDSTLFLSGRGDVTVLPDRVVIRGVTEHINGDEIIRTIRDWTQIRDALRAVESRITDELARADRLMKDTAAVAAWPDDDLALTLSRDAHTLASIASSMGLESQI